MNTVKRGIYKTDTYLLSLLQSATAGVGIVGTVFIFAYDCIRAGLQRPLRFDEFIKHMEFIGNKSVIIIALTALFTGLALSFQIYLGFALVNMTNLVGPTVALGITRELGPVLTGLIVSARAGGAMAARLGSMRVNEQIDALDVMGVNTKQYLIAPRIFAAIVCMPLLTAVFDVVAIAGSFFLCTTFLDLDSAVFIERVRMIVAPRHVFEGLGKSVVFGAMFAVVCTYRGYFTTGGARGVGEATNGGVVVSMVLVIVLDYFLTNLIKIFYVLTGIE